eukprot:TRINITY_DN1703_c0_g1_i1.p2 TRINITY_DN1703_c0_g1~~TRINITY_DN1703_c0_g1_i1.p2  ORF type:complete len:204 (-),score=28.70 TRINITY_DN1703_c0_g1_i1:1655-2233(-)
MADDRRRILARDKANFTEAFETSSDRLAEYTSIRPRATEKSFTRTLDPDTIERINRANKKLSLILYHLANEPSVGLYHVNEHVSRSVPRVVNMKNQLKSKIKPVADLSIDMDSTIDTVNSLSKLNTFASIAQLLQQASQTVDDIYSGRPHLAESRSKDPKEETQPVPTGSEAQPAEGGSESHQDIAQDPTAE